MDTLSYVTLGLAMATSAMVVLVGLSMRQTAHIRQKELKIRLLDKIVDWVTDIQSASLSAHIAPIAGSDSEQDRRKTIADILRYSIPFSKNEYIRAIASNAFKEELEDDVNNLIRIFSAFLFMQRDTIIIDDFRRAFGDLALDVTKEIEGEIIKRMHKSRKQRTEVVGQVRHEYRVKLAEATNKLKTKAGNVTTKLVR